jgi:hypothetical protein
MIDRRTGPATALPVALGLVLVLGGCLPPTSGPAGSGADQSAADATPTQPPVPTGPTPSPSFVRPTPTPMPTFMAYAVTSGDSLNSIAHRFHTTARSIAFWNRATYPSLDPDSARYAPNSIRIGWTLVLIPGVLYDETAAPNPTDTPLPSASF